MSCLAPQAIWKCRKEEEEEVQRRGSQEFFSWEFSKAAPLTEMKGNTLDSLPYYDYITVKRKRCTWRPREAFKLQLGVPLAWRRGHGCTEGSLQSTGINHLAQNVD